MLSRFLRWLVAVTFRSPQWEVLSLTAVQIKFVTSSAGLSCCLISIHTYACLYIHRRSLISASMFNLFASTAWLMQLVACSSSILRAYQVLHVQSGHVCTAICGRPKDSIIERFLCFYLLIVVIRRLSDDLIAAFASFLYWFCIHCV